MASEIPVLPEVGSRITLSLVSSPEASPDSTIASAIRSLTDPVGFWPSSLTHSRTSGVGERLWTWTSGVLPIKSRTDLYFKSTAGDGRQQRDRVALGHLGVELLEVSRILVV